MTISSFDARLKKLNPRFHIRRRTGFMLPPGEGLSVAGLYIGNRYCGWVLRNRELHFRSIPLQSHAVWNPVAKEFYRRIIRRQQRGRREFVSLLYARRLIRRSGRQFLML